ncbi:hypothetical protein Pmani_006274 [Petrolisthes manimaculis]|uniref:Uncharacterized protein n=1 Tax=Petrolisthes manimaculis TaxID=1843537 RepID=A0AAE1UGM8_9EUCA|nr:hypothetical protein Pmani_006274 [Petrolisthes manimaculis]
MEPDQNPASWPDPEDQRMEHDGHIDPQPLIPFTKDIGIQLQTLILFGLNVSTELPFATEYNFLTLDFSYLLVVQMHH